MRLLRFATVAMTVMLVAACGDLLGVKKIPLETGAADQTANGVYDFSFTWVDMAGTHITQLNRFFRVTNGVISSSDGTLRGTVDRFGKATFDGPCPTANGGATYTGSMSALAVPKAGLGTYRCNVTNISNSWRIFNGS